MTGSNDVCGERLWYYLAPLDGTPLGFSVTAEYDPAGGATEAIPLSIENCSRNVRITSYFNPILNSISIPAPNNKLVNIPIQDIFRVSNFDGSRTQLPRMGEVPANPIPQPPGVLSNNLTLGDWLTTKGHLNINCNIKGNSFIRSSYRELIPNCMYSVWGIWITKLPDSSELILFASLFGGVPNAIVASDKGHGSFSRKLNFCPLENSPDGPTLLYVTTAYHSDNPMYARVPEKATRNVNITNRDGITLSTPLGLVVH
ncbi:hypothetical protein [Agarilytica rhodophyticola]|uniref:hypothetical protein n=1 Tax=Agarilytica rhodophyticola TaxID=1737490 RepID=UPI000CD86B67|nr:hypothetical protein [Agarilytica rhodophyticola]